MHITFNLPTGAGGHSAAHYAHKLKQRVLAWAEQNNIQVKNTSYGYILCFEFERDSDYTLFALGWTATNIWETYELIL